MRSSSSLSKILVQFSARYRQYRVVQHRCTAPGTPQRTRARQCRAVQHPLHVAVRTMPRPKALYKSAARYHLYGAKKPHMPSARYAPSSLAPPPI
eukprot:1038117-Rhodomonas_salina.1